MKGFHFISVDTYKINISLCRMSKSAQLVLATEAKPRVSARAFVLGSCSKCYGMDCFGTYFTHVQTCDVTHAQSATEWTASVHTSHMSKPVMHVTHVQSATEWTASAHTSHMSKPVM